MRMQLAERLAQKCLWRRRSRITSRHLGYRVRHVTQAGIEEQQTTKHIKYTYTPTQICRNLSFYFIVFS